MKKVYLAGPMLGCTNEEAMNWREQVKKQLGHLFHLLDPVDSGFANDPVVWSDIVVGDLNAIKEADIVFANCWKPSPGTAMEICHAFLAGKQVVAVNVIQSPWIHYHSHASFLKLEDAVNHLKELV